ncbi:MAG: response regulator, partial [Gammaproteobacteria bacterium]
LGNALKFTERGRIDLKVRMLDFQKGGRVLLRFDVCDTGIGMNEQEQRHIFESFTQANSDISRRFGGTGLGTTIARQLVQLMGGELKVESAPGKGSCFWFVLPLKLQQTDLESEDEGAALVEDSPVWVLSGHPLSLHLADLLQGWHIDHRMTGNAPELLSWLDGLPAAGSAARRHVLLLEQSLLGEDPYSFIEHVAQRCGADAPGVILLAPAPMKVQEAQLLEAGYAAVLYTPVDKVHLYNAIHAAQMGQRQQSEKVVPLFEHYRNRGGASGLNILIAEDNPTNRMVLRGILEKAGHGVNEVNDGESALELLEEVGEDIDLIILDMNMPGMGGLDVVRAWRFLDTTRKIPTIMLTANASEEARAASEEAGVDAFLTKPVDARRLLDTIARLTLAEGERQRAEAAPRASAQPAPADALISPSLLEQLDTLGGGDGFLERLIEGWLRDAERSLAHLHRAHEEKDFALWLDTLHALKGSASELGLQRLMETAAEGERLRAYDNGGERQHALLETLDAVFQASREALQKYLAERPGAARS